ncbi:hypothetical protein PV327_010210 [Microctonus hyperodae]|uniref:Uncharacterized protein n=1 Tax=Microctonus hyperodae TaxID=165561 RepID=A0AA39FRT6_MICHY|nr:hypothetical protein PV327_010210 [Microctonus hyperodae]
MERANPNDQGFERPRITAKIITLIAFASLENQSGNHTSSIATATTPIITPPTREEETPGRACFQNEDCTPNEQCRKKNDNSSCYCLPRFRPNNSTQKCELRYRWVKYTAELFNDTRLVKYGIIIDSGYLSVVARSIYDNGGTVLVDAAIDPYSGIILSFVPYAEKYTNIEVLLIEFGRVKWIESSNGTVEKNAIESGSIGNETVYVCRIYDNFDYHTGMMTPSNRSCHDCYYGKYHQNYSLLTHVNDIFLPEEVDADTGYHVKCHNNFLAVMKKYRLNESSISSNVPGSSSALQKSPKIHASSLEYPLNATCSRNNYSLTRNMRVKVYTRKYGLKIYIRTQTGYKPLKYKFCSKSFGDPINLNKHMR